ncbi:MAG: hypothetical protein KatS3mg060_1724 [Dehalococcoidia bacterium]|nr:MAG: hypothetical protein KatS3mg060_1724 [Dehalococcoidia bacterium]
MHQHRRAFAGLLLAGVVLTALLPTPVTAQPATIPIEHLLVIFMENHTFDNLYGLFPGANGLQSPAANIPQVDEHDQPYTTLPDVPDPRYPKNLPNSIFPMDEFVPLTAKPPTPSHVFYTHQLQVNGGRMNKYVAYSGVGAAPMGYVDTTKLPLYPWAREFTLADNWFTSAWGGSWLNHMWLICACTALFPNAPASLISRPIYDASGRLVGLEGPEQFVTPDGYAVNDLQPYYPPFQPGTPDDQRVPPQTFPTIGDRLNAAGVSWAWYAGGWNDILEGKNPQNFVWHHQPFLYFEAYRPGSENRARHLKDQSDLVAAIRDGTLPAVSFLKPVGEFDEHSGYSTVYYSEQHVAELLAEIRASRYWDRIAVIITYDDYGGWFDHVPPTPKDRWGPGGRVPAIIVSPWAKKGYVDSTLYETVSILRFIEWRWGLPPLNERDATANNILNAFDFGSAEPTTVAGAIARILATRSGAEKTPVIIDAQVHLWEADRPERPWPAGAESHLPEPMTAERFLPLMDEPGVDRAVIAPPFMAGFDPSYALECASRYPDRFAVSSRWDLDDPTWPSRLPTWLNQPGMIGIRLGLRGDHAVRWTENGTLAAFWEAAERYEIPIMVFVPDGLAPVEVAARAHPRLRIVVDHLNLVGPRPPGQDERIAALVALARFPNVGVKVSALPLFSQQPFPFADVHPAIRAVRDAFGAHRMMWGSDQTMQLAFGRATYRESVDLIRAAGRAFLSDDDIDWVLGRTLQEWFRWP